MAANITASWEKIGIKADVACNVRDLWAHSQSGVSFSSLLLLSFSFFSTSSLLLLF